MTSEVLTYAAFTDDGVRGNPAGVVLYARSLNDTVRVSGAATRITQAVE